MISDPNLIQDRHTLVKLREIIRVVNDLEPKVAVTSAAVSSMAIPTLTTIQQALQTGGTNPLNVNGLLGILAKAQIAAQVGLFAARPQYSAVPQGSIFYASDQSTAYVASAANWDTIAKRILFGNNYAIFAATLTADRTYSLPDATDTIVLLNFIQTLTNKQIGDPSDPTKTLAFLLSGATSGKTTTFSFAQTLNRTVTFPDATGNIPVLPTSATTETGTGAIVRQGSPVLTTPTIADFTNAQHNHQSAAGGGTLDGAAIATGTTGAGNLLRVSAAAQIVATGQALAQNGAVASICTYTPSNAVHFFEVAGYVDVTAFTAGTISLQCSYTDPSGNAQTVTIPLASLAGVFSATVGSLTDAQSATLGIVTSGANAITLSTSVSLLSATYNVYAWIKLIQ